MNGAAECQIPGVVEAVLDRGDVLYVPPTWWHHVRTEAPPGGGGAGVGDSGGDSGGGDGILSVSFNTFLGEKQLSTLIGWPIPDLLVTTSAMPPGERAAASRMRVLWAYVDYVAAALLGEAHGLVQLVFETRHRPVERVKGGMQWQWDEPKWQELGCRAFVFGEGRGSLRRLLAAVEMEDVEELVLMVGEWQAGMPQEHREGETRLLLADYADYVEEVVAYVVSPAAAPATLQCMAATEHEYAE